jgi:hypothetical protein
MNMPPLVPGRRKYNRPPKDRTHYGTIHQKLRAELLAKFPLCQYRFEGCTGWSEEADHLRYPARCVEDYAACCSHCHRLKTKNSTPKPI